MIVALVPFDHAVAAADSKLKRETKIFHFEKSNHTKTQTPRYLINNMQTYELVQLIHAIDSIDKIHRQKGS